MQRLRRLRKSKEIRALVRENEISKKDLILPVFIEQGEKIHLEIQSMPGVYRYSLDMIDELLEKVLKSGISGIMLFGIPKNKDELASEAYNENGVTQNAIRYIKENYPSIIVIADVCLCEYTSHGHCGVVENGYVDNDKTLPLLVKTAVSYAKAGADIVAPSDMMDGRVGAIRSGLDEAGYINTVIMSYSAKYASAYYSPFRDAADSAPCFGDRKSYQMDIHNVNEALREIEADVEEGADIVMVKPGIAYLDVLRAVCESTLLPVAVYNVSGEYSMVKAAAANGWIDEKRIVLENMTAFKRAGAKIIITYHALEVAKWLDDGEV